MSEQTLEYAPCEFCGSNLGTISVGEIDDEDDVIGPWQVQGSSSYASPPPSYQPWEVT